MPPEVEVWSCAELGNCRGLGMLSDWGPDLIFIQKVMSPELEEQILKIAPSVFFAHDYQGTCISGVKSHKFPFNQPCAREFGPHCLLHYFPRRCGGLSPVTMARLYSLQARRLSLLRRYHAVVTHSGHMRSELLRHGLSPETTHSLRFCVQNEGTGPREIDSTTKPDLQRQLNEDVSLPVRLLFSGRMERAKGGGVFLDALPEIQHVLGRRVHVVFAGEGTERQVWERKARELGERSNVEVEFVGWVNRSRINQLLSQADLLVIPSLWPEPFGLTGIEAGLWSVPAAAFDVGGISEWLTDGVNGHLAPPDSMNAHGLAASIIRCLQSRETHARLRLGAARIASRFSVESHVADLLRVFRSVVVQKPASSPAG